MFFVDMHVMINIRLLIEILLDKLVIAIAIKPAKLWLNVHIDILLIDHTLPIIQNILLIDHILLIGHVLLVDHVLLAKNIGSLLVNHGLLISYVLMTICVWIVLHLLILLQCSRLLRLDP